MQTLQQRKVDISVIIPVYNLDCWIDVMLDSLKMQNLGKYTAEYIFVLNNCTDNSELVIRESGLECKILKCTKHGCGCARNVGFEESKGKYIWFMDGDDWLLSDTAIRDVLDRAYKDDLNILRIPFKSNKFDYPYFSMVWQYLLKRRFVAEFRFPDYQPAEDDAYMELVLIKAGKSRFSHLELPSMEKPLYFYNYLREGSNMYRWHVLKERNL